MTAMDAWLIGLAALGVINLALCIALLLRRRDTAIERLEGVLRDEFRTVREESAVQARQLREEVASSQARAGDVIRGEQQAGREHLERRFDAVQSGTEARLEAVRNLLAEQLRLLMDDQRRHLAEVVGALTAMRDSSAREQQGMREALDARFAQIQQSNEQKLEQMRRTVDEKLHDTLEKRLGESFNRVSERLEAVQRGLGEMKNLAEGVGDLKRVLTNVKERGTWGEYQLGAILEQVLAPGQYQANVRPRDGGEVVEYAVRLPGRSADADGAPVWLPIDAKFPKEDYERLLAAAKAGDAEQVRVASQALATAVKKSARDIHDKYIAPPATTDFAILFLPTEGLYAEVLRAPGLHDELQQRYRVLAAGPTTLSAILNSLRVGFQTLAIEQRSHEVWTVLGAVKAEFAKFGGVLDKVQKKLGEASSTIESAQGRTRQMTRKLKTVEQLPDAEATALLGMLPEDATEEIADETEDNA